MKKEEYRGITIDSRTHTRHLVQDVGIAMLVIPPFFNQTLFRDSLLFSAFHALGAILVILCSSKLSKMRIARSPLRVWMILVMMSLINSYEGELTGFGWAARFSTVIIVALRLEQSDNRSWGAYLTRLCALLAFFHALVTIVTWLIPGIYTSFIFPRWFAGITTGSAIGYKSGFTSHYSTNGMYLSIGVMCYFSLWYGSSRKRYMIATLLNLFALVLTTKRAHFLFTLIAVVLTFIILERAHGRSLSGSGKVAIGCGALVATMFAMQDILPDTLTLMDRLQQMGDDDSFGQRLPLYIVAIEMFTSHPIFGCGWGSFPARFRLTSEGLRYVRKGYESMRTHNVYLNILAEEGVFGFAVVCVAIFKPLIGLYRLITSEIGSVDRINLISPACFSFTMQAFFILYCMTGNPLYDIQMYSVYLLSCAAGLHLIQLVGKEGGGHE